MPDYDTKLQTSPAGGAPPDVFCVDSFKLPDLVAAGALEPAEGHLTNPDDFYSSLRAAFTIDRVFYCPPKDFSTLALEYNCPEALAALAFYFGLVEDGYAAPRQLAGEVPPSDAFFADRPGSLWLLLCLLWSAGLLSWLALNLFYWPFWEAQADRSWRTTYANCGRFFLRHPGTALALVAVSFVVGGLSPLTVLPLALGAPPLLALVGVTAVRRSIGR